MKIGRKFRNRLGQTGWTTLGSQVSHKRLKEKLSLRSVAGLLQMSDSVLANLERGNGVSDAQLARVERWLEGKSLVEDSSWRPSYSSKSWQAKTRKPHSHDHANCSHDHVVEKVADHAPAQEAEVVEASHVEAHEVLPAVADVSATLETSPEFAPVTEAAV